MMLDLRPTTTRFLRAHVFPSVNPTSVPAQLQLESQPVPAAIGNVCFVPALWVGLGLPLPQLDVPLDLPSLLLGG